ncbi:SEC-C metal-binding domain-containing protein [Candidatus Darwinibacter acetoxidans]
MSNSAANSAFLLESLLARQTKAELLNICRRLQIKGASGLRKSRLVGFLCQRLPQIAAGKMMSWDQTVYDLVHEITTFSQVHPLGPASSSPAEDYLLEEYVGFVEMDESDAYLIIPLEFQELFFAFNGPSCRERVRGNTVIARLSRGLLHYYGCLPLLELAKMINKLLPQPVELARIGEVLREIGFYNWDIVFERGYFCDGRLTDLDYTLSELRAREALEYRPLTYQEAWQAGDPAFFHRNGRQMRELRGFLRKNRMDESVPYFLDLLFSLVQMELSPPEIVYALLEHTDRPTEEDITELALVVFDFYHSAPHWVLKGHSPEEIMDRAAKPEAKEDGVPGKAIVYDFATRRRLSPEAPCPCGSKRTFGHCCGSA